MVACKEAVVLPPKSLVEVVLRGVASSCVQRVKGFKKDTTCLLFLSPACSRAPSGRQIDKACQFLSSRRRTRNVRRAATASPTLYHTRTHPIRCKPDAASSFACYVSIDVHTLLCCLELLFLLLVYGRFRCRGHVACCLHWIFIDLGAQPWKRGACLKRQLV